MKHFLSITALLLTSNVYALVDYSDTAGSDDSQFRSSPAPARKKAPVRRSSKSSVKKRSRGNKGGYQLELKGGVESLSSKTHQDNADVMFYKVHGHIQTPYNIFLDMSHYYASTDSTEITDTSAEQQGNPEFKLGVNWFSFGGPAEQANVDIFGGMRLKQSSDFATSRNDSFVGIETKKRFFDFVLGLGYEFVFTGDPSDDEELKIGNIHRAYGALGWQATYDIAFIIESAYYSVGASDKDSGNTLKEKFTFGYVSPKLNLTLSRNIGLELGALFRTKKAAPLAKLTGTKFWNLPGSYGDTLFANIMFSI